MTILMIVVALLALATSQPDPEEVLNPCLPGLDLTVAVPPSM
jgi:hypothetical protein